MAKKPPLTAHDVERGLKAAGFTRRPQKATSHVHWVKTTLEGKLLKVTVDSPKAPFSPILIRSMASQAGLSVKDFYTLCSKDGVKKAKRGLLSFLRSSASTE